MLFRSNLFFSQLEAPFVGLRDLLKKKKGEKEIQCRFRFSDSLKRKWDQHYKIKLPNFDFVPLDCVRVIEETTALHNGPLVEKQ